MSPSSLPSTTATTNNNAAAVEEEYHRVTSALHIVYDSQSTTAACAQQRHQANQYLIAFQHHALAWSVCDCILSTATTTANQAHAFFAAQTLHTLCQVGDNTAVQRDGLLQHLNRHVTHSNTTTVALRLAMALSALAVHLGWTTILTDMLGASGTHAAALFVVRALPEECASERLQVPDERRFAMRDHMIATAPQVFTFLLEQQQQSSSSTLETFWIWIRHVPLHPSTLLEQTRLVPACIQAMTSTENEEDERIEAVADVLVEIIRMYPSHRVEKNTALVHAMIAALAPLHTTLLVAQQADNETRVRSYCRIVVEMGESYGSLVLLRNNENNETTQLAFLLVDAILACTEQIHDMEICSMTLSFWYCFLTGMERIEPYSRRQAIVDLYTSRMIRVVHACTRQLMRFPNESMEGAERQDYEQRHRGLVAETLDDCCRLLGGDVVLRTVGECLRDETEKATTGVWQGVEACLASLAAMSRYVPRDEATVLPFCFGIMTQLIQQQQQGGGLRRTMNVMMGNYASWLTARPEQIQPLLPYLAQGLRSPGCEASAAVAIKKLCACSGTAAGFSFAQPALELYEEIVAAPTAVLPIKEELQLLEGVCLALSHTIQDTHSDGRDFLTRLAQPIGTRLAALVQSAAHPGGVIPDMDRLTAIMRYLTIPFQPPAVHPLVELMQSAWGLLDQATRRFPQSLLLAESVCRLHKHTLRSCGATAYAPMLEPFAQQLVQSYELTQQSSFLYCASIGVTEFGPDPVYGERLVQLVSALATTSFSFLRNATDFTNHPDTVEELFYLADRLLRYCPNALCASPLMALLVQSALIGMHVDHPGANKGTLKFMSNVVSLGTTTHHQQPAIEQALHAHGPAFVTNMVNAMCGNLPYYSSAEFPEILWKLYARSPHVLAQWLSGALATNGMIPDHAKADFLSSFTTSQQLTQSGFLFAVEEFEQVCHRVKRFRRAH